LVAYQSGIIVWQERFAALLIVAVGLWLSAPVSQSGGIVHAIWIIARRSQ
jgi:hypothetical protein